VEIRQSLKDKMTLAGLRENKNIPVGDQPSTYRDCVVIKPWGNEFLIFKNRHVAVWLLYIKKNHSTSMHCHSRKSTSLVLLSGKALCNTFVGRNFLGAGDAVAFDKGVFHSTKALSLDDIFVLEIESPPDKVDLFRLHDNYGRENYCYECLSQMVYDKLEAFGHFYIDSKDVDKEYAAVKDSVSITMRRASAGRGGGRGFKPDPAALYSLCDGSLTPKIRVGGIAYGRELKKHAFNGQALLMEIKFPQ